MPKVSVILPNYNHARFLAQRISSVLTQTYQDFDVIYLDDASTDHSAEVFAQFAHDRRITSIVNSTNSGNPFKQWNKGIKVAQGEYIWIAETDDYADPHFLETLIAKLESDPDVGLAYCQSREVNEDDRLVSHLEWLYADMEPERWQTDFTSDGKAECARCLIFKNTIPNASAVLFRRAAYESVGGAPEDMRLCGDWLVWAKILSVSNLAFVAEPLNSFRTHARTVRKTSMQAGEDLEEIFKVIHYISQTCDVTPDAVKETLSRLIDLWLKNGNWTRIPLRRQLELYHMMSAFDHNPHRVFWKKIGALMIETLQRPVRSVRIALHLGTRIRNLRNHV